MSGSTSTNRPDDELTAAAIAGARSVHAWGWYGEECESAALEELVRRPCLTAALAYLRGRGAALDELRRLTHHRRAVPGRPISTDDTFDEPETCDESFVEIADLIARARLTARERQVVVLAARGLNGREIADVLHVDPSRVTQLARSARRHLDRRILRAS